MPPRRQPEKRARARPPGEGGGKGGGGGGTERSHGVEAGKAFSLSKKVTGFVSVVFFSLFWYIFLLALFNSPACCACMKKKKTCEKCCFKYDLYHCRIEIHATAFWHTSNPYHCISAPTTVLAAICQVWNRISSFLQFQIFVVFP